MSKLYAWGYNNNGQLGDGTTTNRHIPTQIGTSNWNSVAGGDFHSLGISGGKLYAWGRNSSGQLGDGTTTEKHTPTQIGTSDWTAIAAGDYYSLGISGGKLYAWGHNGYGQLGDGTTTNRHTPTQIGTSNWSSIAGGYYHSLGIVITTPTVTTQSADQITITSIRGNGNITDTGGKNCTRRGFCYKVGTSGDPTVSDNVAYDDGYYETGTFTKIISGLSPETSYRLRAYAVNSIGTSYGDTVDVKTLALAKIKGLSTIKGLNKIKI